MVISLNFLNFLKQTDIMCAFYTISFILISNFLDRLFVTVNII